MNSSRLFARTAPLVALLCLAAAGARAQSDFVTIHTFDPLVDGNTPYSVLTQGADGAFYGTTSTGGQYSNGTLFRVNFDGTAFTVLNAFAGVNAGAQPRGGLVQARDGNFYGTTYAGGAASEGTLFQLNLAGGLFYLGSFTDGASPGANPGGTLVEARDGFLYGTAEYGGQSNFGTVYRFVLGGAPSAYLTFSGDVGGTYPQSDLLLASDGNLYGTTTLGGQFSNGTFFRLTTTGVATILYSFSGGADGGRPLSGVVEGSDGAFYGVARAGGAAGAGVVYRLVLNGNSVTVTTPHQFSAAGADGATPNGLLIAASDGNFYGTTTVGGTFNNGCVFRVGPGTDYANIYSFTNTGDGGTPLGGLLQGNDGRLYGTTAPANGSAGTIFRIDLALPAPTPVVRAFLNDPVAAGDTVLIQGSHFVGTTAISFTAPTGKTIPATSFNVRSTTVLAAVVPQGAITGAVTVTANAVTTTSAVLLTINAGHPSFFNGEVALSNGVFYLQLPDGNPFGYYSYLSDPRYIYHFDLGYEYVQDAADGKSGVYLYDFASKTFFYTSPTFPFPYLYDFSLNSVLYYFPDPNRPGRYTSNPRYFYDFKTKTVITK